MPVTDEQIEAAAKAMYGSLLGVDEPRANAVPWEKLTGQLFGTKEVWMAMARAAVPFLQVPWYEPTTHEAVSLENEICKPFNGMSGRVWSVGQLLSEFVRRRNAALAPKRDVRRDKVSRALSATLMSDQINISEVYDKIIAIMDEENVLAGRMSINEYRSRIGLSEAK